MGWGASRAFGAAVALVAALIGGAAAAQAPASAPAPMACKVGAHLTAIHDVDTATRTFKAEVWLWSVCPSNAIEPLKTLEFVNAVETTPSLDATLQRGNLWWSTRKI